jgi:hypothetical protein
VKGAEIGSIAMGFFASEFLAIMQCRVAPGRSPWSTLQSFGVSDAQIKRLQAAAENIGEVATLPYSNLRAISQTFEFTLSEDARLLAALEADVFLRILLYHNYPLDRAAIYANAAFAGSVKDHLAANARFGGIFPTVPLPEDRVVYPPKSKPAPKSRARRKPKSDEGSSPTEKA